MMEKEQAAGSCPAQGQTAVGTWLSSSTRGATSDTLSRFHGDGVHYKAKLIGVDLVPDAQGDKMCLDSMMKLKGCEIAARKQGKHKQRIWLKISSSGAKIVDERTGDVLYDHERSRIRTLVKDESDLRALAYVYQNQDTYVLIYFKTATLAERVLIDLREVCQRVDQETPQEPEETPAQNTSLLLLNESSASPAKERHPEDVFSPRPDSSSGQANQTQLSSSNELMEVFSIQLEEPLTPTHNSCPTQSSLTYQPESPQPTLSNSQILSMFPTQQVGGSPYSSPPYSPTTMPWGQQGFLGNQWAGPAMVPWPTSVPAWAPPGVTAPPVGSQTQAHSVLSPQSRVMMGGNTAGSPTSPSTPHGNPTSLNSFHTPTGTTEALQTLSPTLDHLL